MIALSLIAAVGIGWALLPPLYFDDAPWLRVAVPLLLLLSWCTLFWRKRRGGARHLVLAALPGLALVVLAFRLFLPSNWCVTFGPCVF